MPSQIMTKEDWIIQAFHLPGCFRNKCDKCGRTYFGFGSMLTAQFKCLYCLADERFAKPKLDVDDFARI